MRALPQPEPAAAAGPAMPSPLTDVAVPLTLNSPLGTLNFLTTITVFGAPHDVLASEIAVETLLPADEPTARHLRAIAGAPG